jgi:predicted RNase H-like nuclease (RuvC/YqgF family)
MIKNVERQIRELQRELLDLQKERNLIILQPCRGDREIRQKDEKIADFGKRMLTIERTIRELEKKRREMMSAGYQKAGFKAPGE